jgi:CopG family transcriptional regulator/antitoxin EndoAI
MPKKVLVALPSGLLEQIDFVAQVEHRTRSDLIRESLRDYIKKFRAVNPSNVLPMRMSEAVHE